MHNIELVKHAFVTQLEERDVFFENPLLMVHF